MTFTLLKLAVRVLCQTDLFSIRSVTSAHVNTMVTHTSLYLYDRHKSVLFLSQSATFWVHATVYQMHTEPSPDWSN